MIDIEYLKKNGYNKTTEEDRTEFYIITNEYWHKQFEDYSIRITFSTTEASLYYGGKDTIEIFINYKATGLAKCKKDYHHMTSPYICFHATGFDDYAGMEQKIKEEIVPSLKRWAIETI